MVVYVNVKENANTNEMILIELFKAYPNKIGWYFLSSNPSIFKIKYNYDYKYLKLRMSIHFKEICIKVFYPKNEGKILVFS